MLLSQILVGAWLGLVACSPVPAEESSDPYLAGARKETVRALTSGVPEGEIQRVRRRLPCAFGE